MKDEIENFSKTVRALESHIATLEKIHLRASSLEDKVTHDSGEINIQDVLSRVNTVQNLLDQIEIQVDNLEMRVSAIEHMGFRLRTGGQ